MDFRRHWKAVSAAVLIAGLSLFIVFFVLDSDEGSIPDTDVAELSVTLGPAAEDGFVFVDGIYLDPPYQIQVVGLEIRINDRVIRSVRELAQGTGPTLPESLRESTDAALERMDQLGPPRREGFEAFARDVTDVLLAFPETAEVTLIDDTLLVTATDGSNTVVPLAHRPTRSRETVHSWLGDEAAIWRAVLADGGAILGEDGAIMIVPASRAAGFIAELDDAIAAAESGQLEPLIELVASSALAEELAAAGPLPSELRNDGDSSNRSPRGDGHELVRRR